MATMRHAPCRPAPASPLKRVPALVPEQASRVPNATARSVPWRRAPTAHVARSAYRIRAPIGETIGVFRRATAATAQRLQWSVRRVSPCRPDVDELATWSRARDWKPLWDDQSRRRSGLSPPRTARREKATEAAALEATSTVGGARFAQAPCAGSRSQSVRWARYRVTVEERDERASPTPRERQDLGQAP